jgi:hypothetical protein
MKEIFASYYELPGLERRYSSDGRLKNFTDEPYDELFVWSLLLYGGEEKNMRRLTDHYWSKCKYPIACCLVAIILYRNLNEKNFIPEDLKDKMLESIKYDFLFSFFFV